MFKYPNKKVVVNNIKQDNTNKAVSEVPEVPMMKNKKKSNLGMTLEKDIEETNKYYRQRSIAIIHKKPTPIRIVKVEYPQRSRAKIVEAYYTIASTTDFNGIYKGKYIDFDVKEVSHLKSFSFNNIGEHQIEHLYNVYLQGGIAFLIVHFKELSEYFLIQVQDFYYYWKKSFEEGERKSLPITFFKEYGIKIKEGYQPRLDYIKAIDEIINNQNPI